MIRWGVCCIFRDQPIRFRRTTARYLTGLSRPDQLEKLSTLCLLNAQSLMKALTFCRDQGIGAFRINSQILPVKTHPQAGYAVADLPGADDIVAQFNACGQFCRKHGIRTSFHPDQFIVLSSPHPGVVARSLTDLVYQSEVADWVGADVINIHGGGSYGDKKAALDRLRRQIDRLPLDVRVRLSLENDDRVYTPGDLLPVCRDMAVPLVYDVHHHRWLGDGTSVEAATEKALETWDREPLFHLSSPLNGWHGPDIRQHHDYIDAKDFPACWQGLDLTVDVEAKAKELAVLKLMDDLTPDRPGSG